MSALVKRLEEERMEFLRNLEEERAVRVGIINEKRKKLQNAGTKRKNSWSVATGIIASVLIAIVMVSCSGYSLGMNSTASCSSISNPGIQDDRLAIMKITTHCQWPKKYAESSSLAFYLEFTIIKISNNYSAKNVDHITSNQYYMEKLSLDSDMYDRIACDKQSKQCALVATAPAISKDQFVINSFIPKYSAIFNEINWLRKPCNQQSSECALVSTTLSTSTPKPPLPPKPSKIAIIITIICRFIIDSVEAVVEGVREATKGVDYYF